MQHVIRRALTSNLEVTYIEAGPSDGQPVVLLHGFPYDVYTYAEIWPALAEAGLRVIVPWLRGFGETVFLDGSLLRSGEQAALAKDLLDLIDVLDLDRPVVAGYDWGGRAACLVSALWPERVRGLVTGGGYNVLRQMDPDKLLSPAAEHNLWYNRILHHPDAVRWMNINRDTYCRHLWSTWSPDWNFDDATFERSAQSFQNRDFDAVVIHSYRHRWGLVDGDPALASLAAQCLTRPPIQVPTVILNGTSGPFSSGRDLVDSSRFTHADVQHHRLDGVGHNIPQEAPSQFANAVLHLSVKR